METRIKDNFGLNLPFAPPLSPGQATDTTNAINAFLLKSFFEVSQDYTSKTRDTAGFEKFKTRVEMLEKFALFFNPAWKRTFNHQENPS